MPRSFFDMFKPLAGQALQATLNRALALDPQTRDGLLALEGQRIALLLDAPALALQIRVADRRLLVGPVDDGLQEPDLAVRGSLGGLLAQLPFLATARRNHPPAGRLRVAGDADLARTLQQLAARFDPDWQLPLVAVFGDVLGVQIANAVRGALRQAQRSVGDLAHSAAEYVTEESRDVVPRAELAAFYEDVDILRDDAERLTARVSRLRAPGGGA